MGLVGGWGYWIDIDEGRPSALPVSLRREYTLASRIGESEVEGAN